MTVKHLRVVPVKSTDANAFVKRWHYSGKVVANSQLHFGVVANGRLAGVMQFGPPMMRAQVLGIVKDTKWSGMMELNRMAVADYLPKNAESRCLSIALKIIKQNYKHIEWVLTYADGTQCGDGTIYRAIGALLTDVRENKTMLRLPDGSAITRFSLDTIPAARMRAEKVCGISGTSGKISRFLEAGATYIEGFMLRYIIPLNDTVRGRLTVPVLPYSAIAEAGARMYRGKALRAVALGSDVVTNNEGTFESIAALHSERTDGR